MAYSLKKMAEACLRAEVAYYNAGMRIPPRFILRLKGRHDEEIVHVLTGIKGPNLVGSHLAYLPDVDKTLVLVKCFEIREFFLQVDSAPEDLVSPEWLEEIEQPKRDAAYVDGNPTQH